MGSVSRTIFSQCAALSEARRKVAASKMAHEEPGTPTFYLYIAIVIGLVLFAGLMSGLTLGLMSLSLVDLEVLQKSGTDADRKHAGMFCYIIILMPFYSS